MYAITDKPCCVAGVSVKLLSSIEAFLHIVSVNAPQDYIATVQRLWLLLCSPDQCEHGVHYSVTAVADL